MRKFILKNDRNKEKVFDSITEIEVSMSKLREGIINKNNSSLDNMNLLLQTQKSLQKLGYYVFKIPDDSYRSFEKVVKQNVKDAKKQRQ